MKSRETGLMVKVADTMQVTPPAGRIEKAIT